MSELTLHTANYEIRAGEVDHRGLLTVPALMQLMQETSLKHVIKLKASVWDMKDASWVLLSKEITIKKLPAIGDTISIATYPAGVNRIYAYRDFWVYDDQGEVIATASSTWTLLNLSTRKLQAIPDKIKELPLPSGFEPLQHAPMKIRFPELEYAESPFYIGYYHLDWNNHVNNVHYLKFILESVSDQLKLYKPSRIHILFKGEALYRDALTVASHFDPLQHISYHKIHSTEDKVITQSYIEWESK